VLFTGFSEHTVDAKLRLAIPAKYRNQWSPERDGNAWYCFPWDKGELRLYTEAVYHRLAQPRENESRLAPDPDLARLQSLLFGLSERLEMDSAGRIQIPKLHLEMIGLPGAGSDVAVVGAGDHLNVLERAAWLASVRTASIPDLAARVQAKGLRSF
jgi:MraZ protein